MLIVVKNSDGREIAIDSRHVSHVETNGPDGCAAYVGPYVIAVAEPFDDFIAAVSRANETDRRRPQIVTQKEEQ